LRRACIAARSCKNRSEYQSGLSGSKNTKRNKALRTLQKQSRGDFTFHRINSVTCRIDRPGKRDVGWLMEVAWRGVARQRWVARVGNRASEQLPLGEAKKAAVTLLRERGKTEQVFAYLRFPPLEALSRIDEECNYAEA